MAHSKRPPTSQLAMLAASSLISAAATAVGLALLATPPDLEVRSERIDELIRKTRNLRVASAPEARWPAGTTCAPSAAAAVDSLDARLTSFAGAAGLEILEQTLTAEDVPGPALEPVAVTFRGRGSYESSVRLLEALAKERPTLFLRAVDMRPKQGVVELELKGTYWCAKGF